MHRSKSGPLMSALGQKRTLLVTLPMSAFPPKADIASLQLDRAGPRPVWCWTDGCCCSSPLPAPIDESGMRIALCKIKGRPAPSRPVAPTQVPHRMIEAQEGQATSSWARDEVADATRVFSTIALCDHVSIVDI